MNRDRFISILRNPELLEGQTDLPLIREMVEAYPYFSTPVLLLTKLLYEDNSIYFDKQLKLTAALMGSREVLYNYLHRKKTVVPEEASTLPPEPEKMPEDEPVIEPAAELESPAGTIVPQTEGAVSEEVALPLEILPPSAYDYFAVYAAEKNKDPDKNDTGRKAEPSETFLSVEKKAYPTPQPVKTGSFSDWLETLSGKDKIMSSEGTSATQAGAKKEKKRADRKDVNEIIADFIGKEPKIKKRQARFYSPETMAHLSAEEPHDVATETLAGIYIQQGLKDKAIEIFQLLSLRFPEKSAYFAEKIKGLKEN